MTHPFQDELANALENLRNERERNAVLERENDDLRNELERSQHLLFLAENPGGVAAQQLVPVTVMVPADQVGQTEQAALDAFPFTDHTFTANHTDN